MREVFNKLKQLGKMPNQDLDNDSSDIQYKVLEYQTLLGEIKEPIEFDEGQILLSILPDEMFYDLQNTIVGLIESIELNTPTDIEQYKTLLDKCENKDIKGFLYAGLDNWLDKTTAQQVANEAG